MSDFLSKLFGSGSAKSAAPAFSPETYKGFVIAPQPRNNGGQFNIAGSIRKDGEQDGQVHEFIRADTFTDIDEAVRFSVIKAKQIIDQKGDKMFNSGGGW